MSYARPDRFGNMSILRLCKPVINKKTGEEMPIFRGNVEIGNQLYRIDISHSNKAERPGMWCKITKMVKRQNSGFGGGGFGGGQQRSGL